MAISFVGQRGTTWLNSTGALSRTLTSLGATANNLLIASLLKRASGGSPSVSTGWTLAGEAAGAGATHTVWYRIATGDSSDNITVTWGDPGEPQLTVWEYTGNATIDTLDSLIATKYTYGTTNKPGSLTPNSSAGAMISVLGNPDALQWRSNGPFIDVGTRNDKVGGSLYDPLQSIVLIPYASTAAIDPTWSTTDTGGAALGVQVCFKEPSGSSSPVNQFITVQIEALANTVHNAQAHNESLTHIAISFKTNIESLTDIQQTFQNHIETLAGIYKTTQQHIEASAALSSQYQIAVETLTNIQKELLQQTEVLATIDSQNQVDIESLGNVSRLVQQLFEVSAAISSQSQVDIEVLNNIQTELPQHLEALTGVTSQDQMAIEALANLVNQYLIKIESLGTGINTQLPFPLECLAALSKQNVLQFETQKRVNTLSNAGIENLTGIRADRVGHIESLTGVSNDAVINFESLGLTAINADAVIYFESGNSIASGLPIQVEALAAVDGELIVAIEALQYVQVDHGGHIEAVAQISLDIEAAIEALQPVANTFTLSIESLRAVSGSATLSVEALQAIALAVDVPFEVLQRAGVNVIVDVVTKQAYFSIRLDRQATFGQVVTRPVIFH